MFNPDDILYEDNHLLIVNKRCGDLVQPDPSGESALEDQIKAFIKRRDAKPGEVFLGVVHRIDRPVSGAVVFAKTSKALVRLNEMIRDVFRRFRGPAAKKCYSMARLSCFCFTMIFCIMVKDKHCAASG